VRPRADCVVDIRARLGEGAVWSVARQALYWVDLPQGRLHRHTPGTGADESWDFHRALGCVAETASARIVAALPDGFFLFDTGTGEERFLAGPCPERENGRFNDGTVDPRGRFLAGTLLRGPDDEMLDTGTLYRFDGTGDGQPVVGGFRTINGLAFSPDGRTAYVSDSQPDIRRIWAYDHDPDDGAWTNPRLFFDTRDVPGRPDGAAVDADGCYWMAGVGGWHLLRLTPDGQIDMDIAMPVERPTRIAFGGRDLATIYVTSIHVPDDPRQPQSGGVFALEIAGIRGLPMPVMPDL
jgi:L-arabinonolactonase